MSDRELMVCNDCNASTSGRCWRHSRLIVQSVSVTPGDLLVADIEAGRKQIIDLTCKTCGGNGKLGPFAHQGVIGPSDARGSDEWYYQACPSCNGSGQVEAIVIRKEGGEWPKWVVASLIDAFGEVSWIYPDLDAPHVLDALAEGAYRTQGESANGR